MHYQRGVRLFWPIILIGVGAICSWSNLGVIQGNPWNHHLPVVAGALHRAGLGDFARRLYWLARAVVSALQDWRWWAEFCGCSSRSPRFRLGIWQRQSANN
jgi:hypothetical protein